MLVVNEISQFDIFFDTILAELRKTLQPKPIPTGYSADFGDEIVLTYEHKGNPQ